MRVIRSIVGALLITGLALVAGAGTAVAAGNTSTYTGVFAGRIDYQGCTVQPPPARTSGTWSVTLHGTSAKAEFNILVNGQPHVAYTFPGMKLSSAPGAVFVVSGATQAGPLTVTLYDNGSMTYVIAPYSYGGLSCTSVTYPGHLGT